MNPAYEIVLTCPIHGETKVILYKATQAEVRCAACGSKMLPPKGGPDANARAVD